MVEVFSGIGEGAFLCANRGFLEVDIIEKDLKVQGLRVENCMQKAVSDVSRRGHS